MANNMVSNNTDYSRTSEANKSKPDSNVSDVLAPTTSKRILLDCELDLLESECFFSSESGSINKTLMGNSNSVFCTNLLTRLKGQKWQQFLDYEKVLKQMRCIEKVNLNTFNIGSYSSNNSKAATSLSGVAITCESRQGAQKEKQVQRLNGNEMQYYGLTPKQKALETVICNVCNGIYTKVGFSNHVIQQHGTVWSNIPERTIATEADTVTKTTLNIGEEHMREIEHMELVGISSDSSATVSSSTSSSPSSSIASSCFGNSTRATKVYRSNSSGGSISTSGRSRSKANRQQQHLPISTTSTNVSASSPSTTTTSVADLLLPNSRNSKPTAKKSAQANSNFPATSALIPSAETFVNVRVKVLPTFGNTSNTVTENNITPAIRGSFSNLSNSSTSSSSTSSTSSKVSSKSAMSSTSLTFPTITVPLTDVSNNITPQFEIVSSSTGHYLDSGAKEVKSTNFSVESYDKTDENSTVKNPSEMRDLTSTFASAVGVMSTVESLSNMVGVPDTGDRADVDNSALHPQSTVEFSNLSTGLNADRQCLFGLLSATSNFSCGARNDVINLNQNNMSPLNNKKMESGRNANRKEGQENPEMQFKIQSFSNEKSKFEHANKSASSNNLSDPHHQVVENLCYQRCHNQNSSNENSVLVLDGIFDNSTQLDVLDSKFITEILNNPQSDINFEHLEESSVQLRLQPATKRLRLDVNTLRKTRENSFTCFDQPQQKMLVSENSDPVNNTSIRICKTNEDAVEFQSKHIKMHYHTEINDLVQPPQDPIPGVRAMQFNPLVYQQCSFDGLGGFEERGNQMTINCAMNTKEIIDLSKENLILANNSTTSNLRQISTAVEKEVSENEFIIDNESCESMEWRFKISTVPSLTDDGSEVETIGTLQGLRRESSSLPEKGKLLLETRSQNQVPINQQEDIKKLLTQQSLTNLGQCNPKNTHNPYIRIKSIDNKYFGIQKENYVYYDFSRLDTLHLLNLSSNAERKSKPGHKQFCDEFIFSINIFNSLPHPLTMNNFAIIKFPLAQATVFRKVALTSRKANNNQITFSNSNAVIGNCINGYLVSGSSIQTRYNSGNTTKNNLNTLTSNTSAFSNSNDFSAASLTTASAVFNNPYALSPKQQKIDPVEHMHRPSSYNNMNSTINSNMQGISLNRHHKSIIGNSFNSNLYGKHKSPINTVAPVAIVNPTARFSTLTQSYPNINHCSINNLHNSQTAKTVYIHNSSMGIERVKPMKRLPIAKLNSFKCTFFTPKLITELILANSSSLAADLLGIQNGKCDNIGKSRFVTCCRKRRIYGKRRIFKLSPQPVKIMNSTVKVVGEKKEKMRQAFLS